MTVFNKALIGTAAAAAMAVCSTPVMANGRDNGGIGTGEIIAGALVIGGIAAIAAASNNRRNHFDRGGFNNDFRPRDGSRRAVNQCIRAAEIEASRFGGRADVTQIRDIDRRRDGFRVDGRIIVSDNFRGQRGFRRGFEDNGRFTCFTDRGRVSDVRFRGLGNYR